jgi:holo-[acyl-carrier protein] synthase
MEERIKEIVSLYTKIPAEQIGISTIIDRSSVNSSITLHRMYAKLAEEGFAVRDYWDIKNFRDLMERANGISKNQGEISDTLQTGVPSYSDTSGRVADGIGIDIEEIGAMPETDDFREDAFYKMHFSSSETAYCILQPEPLASFAGLFAAKEAIIKADNNYKKKPFHMIEIEHTEAGKPFHPDFQLSISHTKTTAVAVAISSGQSSFGLHPLLQGQLQGKPARGFSFSNLLVLVSLLLSAFAIYLAWKRN